jgi:superfamily II DNA or RNA helicase
VASTDVSSDQGLRSRNWLLSYRTSSTIIDGRPVDILHDFYVPALSLAVQYDRVAGYFRSSSLAAASQGYSAFVGRKGKMRLIVGTDLDPEDVRAILAGDAERLAARLRGELESPEAWPKNVKNGVTLLAWMVAHGYLEVRVAFRLHRITGEPLPFDAVDDGYVHEKWFILRDEFGNRLYGTGTLNESKTALVLNAENIDVHCDWWGEMECRRIDEAEQAFEKLWEGRVPHLPVLTLPEAVKRHLVSLADGIDYPLEVDGTSTVPRKMRPPGALERLRFAVLRDAPRMPGGRFVGLETAPVAPWPHQAMVARRLVRTWPYSYLLCDEVGLGKTIEAGLAFRSLYLSGLAKRILIAAPASLTNQWQREMASKMLLSFGLARATPETVHEYIFPVKANRKAQSLYEPDLVIISTGLLARRERAIGLLASPPFDIALVDEAHALRRNNPTAGCKASPRYGELYTSVRDCLRPRTRALWLATATPLQLHPVEVCDLLALTDRVGPFQFDPTLMLEYYEILGKLVRGEEPEKEEWEFLRQSIRALEVQDNVQYRFIQEKVAEKRIAITLRQWLEYGIIPRGKDRELIYRVIFSASPLGRVRLRNTRGLLEIYREEGQLKENLPRRHIMPLRPIEFSPLERDIYESLEEYCRGLARQIRHHGDRRAQQMVSYLLSFLRLRFASSLYAFHETLRRRLEKVEATLRYGLQEEVEEEAETAADLQDKVFGGESEGDQEVFGLLLRNRTPADLEWERAALQGMLERMKDLTGPSSKMTALLELLEKRRDRKTRRIRQTVIFTRFYDTLQDIVRRLRHVDQEMLIGTYSGQGAEYYDPQTGSMVKTERERVKERFLRGEIDVLVCTDAAAEGLNLQTADVLINFDLPWNPMKVEQRIGRIDRIGQKHEEVYVCNLFYANSAEEAVYSTLLHRLSQANLVVGPQQFSLLPVLPNEFRELAEGSLNPEELYQRALKRMEEQRRNNEKMEIPPRELYQIYLREAQKGERWPAPVKLADIWEALSSSQYLSQLGCEVKGGPERPMLILRGVSGVPDGAILTTCRKLYEEGLGEDERRVHFASYGEPFFEAVLEEIVQFELPACVRRVAVPVPGIENCELVGYAVACRGTGGLREIRFVLKWSDLKGLELAEEEALTEGELEPLREELKRVAQEEFELCNAAGRIERFNVRAARAQELLNLLTIESLLKARAPSFGQGALFYPVLRDVESLLNDRSKIIVSDVPADELRAIAEDVLFDCEVPAVGSRASITINRILLHTSMDAAERVVDGMKERRSKLRVDRVISRLRREMRARLQQLS